MNTLISLQNLYLSNCNEDWEHTYGIHVDTLDNPGWSVDIDIYDTTMENVLFVPVSFQRTESDWVFCDIENYKFRGRGGAANLDEILIIFLDWAEQHSVVPHVDLTN